MPDLPERKVGIVACSGEELAEGTVTRLAALKVLNELRRGQTVTICLPLFLAGGQGDRAFARFHPTITVDGCDLKCAARGTEMYSGKPTASIVVNELVAERALAKPEGRRCLNEAGRVAVEVTAQRLAVLVDEILARSTGVPELESEAAPRGDRDSDVVTCSCGSGIPITKLEIAAETVEVLALPLIFRQFKDAGRRPDEATARDLLETVKVYNAVPTEAEKAWRDAVAQEYATYCQQEVSR